MLLWRGDEQMATRSEHPTQSGYQVDDHPQAWDVCDGCWPRLLSDRLDCAVQAGCAGGGTSTPLLRPQAQTFSGPAPCEAPACTEEVRSTMYLMVTGLGVVKETYVNNGQLQTTDAVSQAGMRRDKPAQSLYISLSTR